SYTSKRDKKPRADESSEGEVQQITGEEEVALEEDDEEEEGPGPYAPNAAGMNRFIWDYRYAKPARIESGSRGAREEALENVGGPRAVPGNYQVRLTVGDQTFTESFSVLADPRLSVTAEQLREQFELKLAIRDRTSETNTAVNQIRRIREQVEAWEKRAGDRSGFKEAARSVKGALRSVESELINVDFEKTR